MKKPSYETFLFSEMQRLSNMKTKSLNKVAEIDNFRSNIAIVAIIVQRKKIFVTSSEKMRSLVIEAFKIIDNKESIYTSEVKKMRNIYDMKIKLWDSKIELANYKIPKNKIYEYCKKTNINYGNAFKFFVKKESGALSREKVLKILKEWKASENSKNI